MTGAERGFLLLTGHLGIPGRRPLTTAQFRTLAQRVRTSEFRLEDRDMAHTDIMDLGYNLETAMHIIHLLSQEEQLDAYLQAGERQGCTPLTWVTPDYPSVLKERLGADSPGVLWCRGDLSLLRKKTVSLVGSRDLYTENRLFAWEVGAMAARSGFALVSGNARGADTEAQESCLAHGGCVISVVADDLRKTPLRKHVLYVSEEGFDLPFSAARALSRNRVIHALGSVTFVAQCAMERGGTWKGTMQNLRNRWSPVRCFDDGSAASRALESAGAVLIRRDQLQPERLPIQSDSILGG